ncbi:MAG: DEAD/DEAH box helicase family protein [Fimbriimonadaceae bacterium]|nr:DEAD/DEAH box helicase family protein [Fimbriimonadaceae bacterium]
MPRGRPRGSGGQRQMLTAPMRFDQKLVLVRWLLSLFDAKQFEDLAADLKQPEHEGWEEDNTSKFLSQLLRRTVEYSGVKNDDLTRYDNNIFRHTQASVAEHEKFEGWKYFQYLSLLFAEIYLDRYFRDPHGLLSELNVFSREFCQETGAGIEPYKLEDLRKLAFWSATGSGKTLLMHVNILQYKHYLKEHGRERDLNRIILLTPNEGLSRQHLEEFALSGMEADIFRKDGASLFSGNAVEIIEIQKLKEEMGDKTVAIEAFEGNNLVLVDEGHRGAGSDGTWMEMRRRLSEQGFSFEYSATFGQVIRASTGANRTKLEQEYAKCILFDYSYKYFYRDGYGKEYRILNLANDDDDEIRSLYLSACLLSFYQQLRLHKDRREEFAKFLIEKPLAIFVGGSVTKTLSDRDASDVVSVLLFLKEFISNRSVSESRLSRLLNYDGTLRDQKGRPVFGSGAFDYLNTVGLTAEQAFAGILELMFNAPFQAALHVDLLKGSDGELTLRLGDNVPFGVINVGDAPKLHAVCEKAGLITEEKQFSGSVFARLNNKDSGVNVLIGSRKFTEGWNSWRVSTMGLMNIGRSEGSQIIQLFGRGVRLKGHAMSLKRSSMLDLNPKPPKSLRFLETLNVFGVRADYMTQFKEMLEAEGVPPGDFEDVFELPVINNLGSKKLKVLDVPKDVDFKRQGKKPHLEPPFPGLAPVSLNWYPKIQAQQSKGAGRPADEIALETHKFSPMHTAFFNLDEIWFELQNYKAERSWYNLNLSRESVIELLQRDDWYTLYIPEAELEFTDFGRVRRWQEIAVALLKKYVERLYLYRKAEFERPHTQYREITPDDPNFIQQYRIWVDQGREEVITKLNELKALIESGQLREDGWSFDSLVALGFSRHLYRPLLHLKNKVLEISPVPLNVGEQDFVEDLRKFYEGNRDFFNGRELYLLRNMSRGRGIGFFEAGNFYPDFILWLVEGDRQFVTFIDPKGIRQLSGLNDPKIEFSKTIKELEVRLDDPSVVLNSFIVATTPFKSIGWWAGDEKREFEDRNVLFQVEDKNTYIEAMLTRVLEPASIA